MTNNTHGIAIVGMAGRFPGAQSVEELWQNLVKGLEAVSQLDVERWAEEVSVHPALLERPDLVKMKPRIDGEYLFDAGFFGLTPREAQVLDPQQRLFLECAFEALENAGYDSERFPGAIGVCAGVSQSSYLMNYLQWDRTLAEAVGAFNIGLGNMNDSLATRVAYKLNLKGAAYSVQSFCSTSLVAVHLACQSLSSQENDMVLAGGVTLYLPHDVGYAYQEGGILSPDGHTRTFDAKARGMVFGSGLGIVVLRRLSDALRDGDTIHAVIRGSALNNDGSLKVGFSAPSVTGQAEVIGEALAAAEVDPASIGYVEAHGTGTGLGDPAEIAGLTKAWRRFTDKKGFCAIGSVKSNVGHLDAAAGVTGLIKATLALERELIPKSLHFESPNPVIDFASSPFYVAAEPVEWKRNGVVRRAAVSSFGIGGTNAHAVLEEAPASPDPAAARPFQLLVLSARTETALERKTAELASFLETRPEANLADAAYTLQVGRRIFNHRRTVVARDVEDAVLALRDPARQQTALQERQGGAVAFMFTGQGSQYPNMGRGLYETEAAFREAVDVCSESLLGPLGLDLRQVLFPAPGEEAEAAERLQQTRLTQPALFVVEYALAQLWTSWGIRPDAMIGHSIGEYVAAHLAGVFGLEDALSLVAERGRLIQELPRGAMLAVPLSEEAVRPYLGQDLALASLNAPGAAVVSGPQEAIDRVSAELSARGVMSRALRTSHAFHSAMMEPILEPFRKRVEAVERREPSLPFLSNVTGDWIRSEEATDPGYWTRHLRGCVRFAAGLDRLLADREGVLLLEVGPGNTLSALARQTAGAATTVVSSLRHPKDPADDRAHLLGALGRLWLAGASVDEKAPFASEQRRRIPLPTYPFERQEYRVGKPEEIRHALAIARGRSARKMDLADWFYQPSWRRVRQSAPTTPATGEPGTCLVFADEQGLGDAVIAELHRCGRTTVRVGAGSGFAGDPKSGFTVQPGSRDDYVRLLRALGKEAVPTHVVHLWGVTGVALPDRETEGRAASQELGFFSLLFLAQALASENVSRPLRMAVVSDHMQDVIGGELSRPEKSTVLGPCRVIPQELKNVSCVSIDVLLDPESTEVSRPAAQVVGELLADSSEPIVAYRGPHRWVQWIEPFPLDTAGDGGRLREGGVYLITGGLGGIGLALAEHLAEAHRARLVLTTRSPLPPREEWPRWLEGHDPHDGTSRRIRQVRHLEDLGGQVLVAAADVASRSQMESVVAEAERRFGPIQGAIHAAGVAGGGVIALKQREVARSVLLPKVEGTLVLEQVLAGQPLDFLALCSSTTAWIGGVGQVDYCGANAFLDAFAHSRSSKSRYPVVSINWYAWSEVGMAVKTPVSGALRDSRELSLKVGIGSKDGVEAFRRALAAGLPDVAVFTTEIMPRLLNRFTPKRETPGEERAAAAEAPSASEPAARARGAAPAKGELEDLISESWRKVLGHRRIDVNDNFFELGGDSLMALQAVSLLKARLGRDVPIVAFYEAPTVARLAKVLGTEAKAEEPAVELGEVGRRADTRLEMMQRRRRARAGTPVEAGEPR